jgi:FkbM family methyltransferase
MTATRSAFGWVLPGSDRHFSEYLASAPKVEGRRMYQPQHIEQSLAICRGRRVAVDAGAHVGFWSYYLALGFGAVHAFEPSELFAQCFERNVRAKNVVLHRVALGDEEKTVALEVDAQNTGATHVRPGAAGEVPMRTLDGYRLDEVDFLKVDVEGYERQVLEGARETLVRCRPVVIVEQKDFAARYGGERYGAAELLQSLGAVALAQVVQDLIFGWPDSPAVRGDSQDLRP